MGWHKLSNHGTEEARPELSVRELGGALLHNNDAHFFISLDVKLQAARVVENRTGLLKLEHVKSEWASYLRRITNSFLRCLK
jgi:hypothetical protein